MTVVAIDGPAGAGKSTVARAVAEALGWAFVDTGAMYRAVALAALEQGIDPSEADAVTRVALALDLDVDGERVTMDGRDVSARIRKGDVTAAVPAVAAHPDVRSVLAKLQRELARRHDVVMEGRDIGTAVVPTAQVKVYLTASLPVRALRRALQLGLDQDEATIEEVSRSMRARDAADSSRRTSPLALAEGALAIDSTDLTVEGVVRLIVERVREVRDER